MSRGTVHRRQTVPSMELVFVMYERASVDVLLMQSFVCARVCVFVCVVFVFVVCFFFGACVYSCMQMCVCASVRVVHLRTSVRECVRLRAMSAWTAWLAHYQPLNEGSCYR